jgi:hypothetical protein
VFAVVIGQVIFPQFPRPALSTLWREVFSRRRFFNLTIRELFSPSKALFCDFAEKNATRSVKEEGVGAAPYTPPLPPALWGNQKR